MILEKQIKCLALSQQIKQMSVLVHVFFFFIITLVNFGVIVQLWVNLKSKYCPVPQLLNFIMFFNLLCLKAPGNVGKLSSRRVVGRGRQSPLLSKFIFINRK